MSEQQSPAARPGQATASARELLLCQLFSEVLGVPVGPDDDFFELGGDSVMVMRLVPGIEAALGVEMEIEDLMTHPTPATLALHLPELVAATGLGVPEQDAEPARTRTA